MEIPTKHLSRTVSCLAAIMCAAGIASMAACGDRRLSPSSPTPVSLSATGIGSSNALHDEHGAAGEATVDQPSHAIDGFDFHDPTLPAATCEVDLARNQATWSSFGTSVSGFITRPQGDGPFPAVLVLHTSGGLTHELSKASLFADKGYVALAPDYFTPEGITPGQAGGLLALTTHVDRIREHLSGGIECLKSLSYVDATRIGTVGFSLGGYFGLIVGARGDVQAVVSYYGAYHGEGASRIPTKYPFTDVAAQVRARVLMFHGEADSTVGINLARNAQRRLREAGKQVELVVYPGVDHTFDRVGAPTYDAQATADAGARTLAFLP